MNDVSTTHRVKCESKRTKSDVQRKPSGAWRLRAQRRPANGRLRAANPRPANGRRPAAERAEAH